MKQRKGEGKHPSSSVNSTENIVNFKNKMVKKKKKKIHNLGSSKRAELEL